MGAWGADKILQDDDSIKKVSSMRRAGDEARQSGWVVDEAATARQSRDVADMARWSADVVDEMSMVRRSGEDHMGLEQGKHGRKGGGEDGPQMRRVCQVGLDASPI